MLRTDGRTQARTDARTDVKTVYPLQTKFAGGINMSSSSQDIEQKRNFGVNKGP